MLSKIKSCQVASMAILIGALRGYERDEPQNKKGSEICNPFEEEAAEECIGYFT